MNTRFFSSLLLSVTLTAALLSQATAAVILDENFDDPALAGWTLTYDNTDTANCTFSVQNSLLNLTYAKPTGTALWTSLGLMRSVPSTQDFHLEFDTRWAQDIIASAPFIKLILYSGNSIVLTLNYEDKSRAGFGVNRCYATHGGWNLVDSVPSAAGNAHWEVDRVGEQAGVRLNGNLFFTFSDSQPITSMRIYLQGYAMVESSMPWTWEQPLAIGIDRVSMLSEAQNSIPTAPTLWVPTIFSDKMIIQQGKPVPVWGKAPAGEQVTVKFDQQEFSTAADQSGKWRVEIPAQIASFDPHTISVIRGQESMVFNDVLVGEVWLCSGQSNMEWWLGYTKEVAAAMASPDDNLRLFTVFKETTADTPIEDPRGRWLPASRDTVGDFSAVAYHFGSYLREHFNIPVGLVVPALGGTRAQCWVPRSLLEQQFPQVIERWQHDLEAYDANTMSSTLNPMLAYYRPGGLYCGMLSPVKTYAVRGFVWYQGESDSAYASDYRSLFPALINQWRQDWTESSLPFIFVQLPNYGTRSSVPRESDWAALRDAQNQALKLAAVNMAVTIDIGDPNFIHPDNKKEVGRRLCLAARKTAYGETSAPQSPRLAAGTGTRCGSEVLFRFDEVSESGLLGLANANAPTGFTIAGQDKIFYPATARFAGNNTIIVSSESVQNPVEVRYAWDFNPLADLFDKGSMLPVGTFSVAAGSLVSDINNDCYVNMLDLLQFAQDWLVDNDPQSSGSGVTTSETLLYDNFNDRERLNQLLPDSAHWYKRITSGAVDVNTTIADYRLDIGDCTSQQVWAHFAPANEPVLLEVGGSIKVSMRLSLLRGADTSWNRALMWGLFNSKGTRDAVDNTGTGGQRVDDCGYYIETNPGRTTAGYAKVQKLTTGTINDHFANPTTLGTFSSFLMTAGVGYDVDMTIAKISETALSISGRVGPGYTVSGVTTIPPDDSWFGFDTVSLLVDGRAFPGDIGALTIDRVNVTHSRPTTCSEIINLGQGMEADLNKNCRIEMADYAIFVEQWLNCSNLYDANCNAK